MAAARLTEKDFEEAFGEELTPYIRTAIQHCNFEYEELDPCERDLNLRKIIEVLLSDQVVEAGSHRKMDWEVGWGENLGLLAVDFNRASLLPKYFGKYPIVRWRQRLIKPCVEDFEYRMLNIIQDWLFEKHELNRFDQVYEFGCGTGHNLLRLRDKNDRIILWGLDWASSSQQILSKYAKESGDQRLFSSRFDYFQPDHEFKIESNSLVYTIASLEQVGEGFGLFVEYLLQNKPRLCIHIEPITELLDETDLMDYLSIKYIEKRKYLRGFYRHLLDLQKDGKIKILQAQRTFIGSFFIEGYSVIVWYPI